MGERILVVDDDKRVLQTFSRYLRLEGHTVLTASNGADALDVFKQSHPAIVFTDVRMPPFDGFELLKAIRQRDGDAEVILITGHSDMDMAIAALRTGASDFIPKPISPDTLASALRNAEERLRLRRELHQAQEALRASEEHYRAIAETAFVGVIIVDVEHRITFVNQAAAELLGYTREILMGVQATGVPPLMPAQLKAPSHEGMKMTQLMSPESDDLLRYEAETARTWQGQRAQYETVLRHKKGTPISVLVSAAPLQGADSCYALTLNVIVDITERKRAEAALEAERALLAERVAERTAELRAANEELARAARLKDEFLANMSHELRTPLNAILGLSEALRRELHGPLNDKQREYLGIIEEGGRHLLSLINDILDLSKIAAGKAVLQPGLISIPAVCRDSVQIVQPLAQKKQLHIALNLDENAKTMDADNRRLKQILVNLLGNAVKFTPSDGEIGLDVVQDDAAQIVRFTVWDTGIGIPKEDIERLFQPFVQLDSSLSRQFAGTGLGLALVHRLTQMHDGHIAVESQPGKGSRFTISLPRKHPDNK